MLAGNTTFDVLQTNFTVRGVIFELDQTLLDREKSLLNFLTWQCVGMLKPHLEDHAAMLDYFIEAKRKRDLLK